MIITRELSIDMGHRVTNHGGKCKNLHGHRYRIEASVFSDGLVPAGEEEGMILDFGFLKEMMMKEIDGPCDHGMCLWYKDPQLSRSLGPLYQTISRAVELTGHVETSWQWGKLYVLDTVPTAENLARHWFLRLVPLVKEHLQNNGIKYGYLSKVVVWETPNCSATYHVG